MIFPETKLRILDNSGGKWARCIKIFNSSKKRGLKPLGIMLISIQKIKLNKNNVYKKKMYKAVLIRRIKNFNRQNGISLSFKENAIILLNEKNNPIGSRIIGPVYQEFRSKFFSKIVILSNISI